MPEIKVKKENSIWRIVEVLTALLCVVIVWNIYSPLLKIELSDQADLQVIDFKSLASVS